MMNRPERKYDRYSVPGRNGDIFVMQDAWQNVEQTYEVWFENGVSDNVVDRGYSITEWLFGASDYAVLTDDFDPDHYRKAVFLGPYDIKNILMKYGRAEITFDCDPRRFLMSGLEWIDITKWIYGSDWTEVHNPTMFHGLPVFELTCSVNMCRLLSSEAPPNISTSLDIHKTGTFTINCEKESIVDESGNPAFDSVYGEFPRLGVGTTYVSFDDPGANPVTCKMQPNWWTL